MGYYINPEDMEKEKWLATYGNLISAEQALKHSAGENDQLVVCLIDNNMFTAAGIAYDDRERDAFMMPDNRNKKWYLVDKELLKPYM